MCLSCWGLFWIAHAADFDPILQVDVNGCQLVASCTLHAFSGNSNRLLNGFMSSVFFLNGQRTDLVVDFIHGNDSFKTR